MSDGPRREKIELYGAAYETLAEALKRFPEAMWNFRPAPEQWTIHEIVVHITDSEANSYVRGRRLIAEPGSDVLGYNEMQWAAELDYSGQSAAEALELFKWLRRMTYNLIKDLPDSTWAHTVNHSESGPMTMDRWLEIYANHIPDHVAQMQAVYDEWASKKG